jgi:hypothetical protein
VPARLPEDALKFLTLLGLLFYGLGLLAYSRFYGAFGVGPEEVGLSYIAALSHIVPAFFVWLWTWLATLAVLSVFVILAREVLPSNMGNAIQNGAQKAKERFLSSWRSHPVPAVVVVTVALLGLFEFAATNAPSKLADRVFRGKEVGWTWDDSVPTFFDTLWRNPLRIQVERVRVWPAGRGIALPANLTAGATVFYLGRTADTVILYDNAGRGRTLRIPASLIVLSRRKR